MNRSADCGYFWKHICIRPEGKLSPCCHFVAGSNELPRVKDDFSDLAARWNSPLFKGLRTQALSGNRGLAAGCIKCERVEKVQKNSLREWANWNYPTPPSATDSGDLSQVEYLEIFVGDLCNLKCLTCGPDLSTSWRQDYERLGWKMPKPASRSLEMPEGLLNQLSGLKEIKFVGGEPLLSKFHLAILEGIPKEQATKIKLSYYTNATISPSEKLKKLWDKFAHTEIWLSIDGYGKINEYIRYPSEWTSVEQVVLEFMDYAKISGAVSLGLHCTVNAYNIFSLSQLDQWYRDLHQRELSGNPLKTVYYALAEPSFLAIQNLPVTAKERAAIDLNPNIDWQKELLNVLWSPASAETQEQFENYSDAIDSLRGTSWRSLLPEAAFKGMGAL